MPIRLSIKRPLRHSPISGVSSLDLKNSLQLTEEEYRMAITAYGWAGFYMIRQWISEDIDKTPQEMMDLMGRIFGNRA